MIISRYPILPKDYLKTAEGLFFAVVDYPEKNSTQIFGYLRYCLDENGQLNKLNTEEALALLEEHYPRYLQYVPSINSVAQVVNVSDIVNHYSASAEVDTRVGGEALDEDSDQVSHAATLLLKLLMREGLAITHLGITGSILLNAQSEGSDIDLVVYDGLAFQQARRIVKQLQQRGIIANLSANEWRDTFERRGSVEISFDEYLWHEKRKYNKGMFKGIKFDISLVPTNHSDLAFAGPMVKLGDRVIRAKVSDSACNFDLPAIYSIEHNEIERVVTFSATYIGQAEQGEMIEVSGMLEVSADGRKQIVVGANREADGHFIRVIHL